MTPNRPKNCSTEHLIVIGWQTSVKSRVIRTVVTAPSNQPFIEIQKGLSQNQLLSTNTESRLSLTTRVTEFQSNATVMDYNGHSDPKLRNGAMLGFRCIIFGANTGKARCLVIQKELNSDYTFNYKWSHARWALFRNISTTCAVIASSSHPMQQQVAYQSHTSWCCLHLP